MAEPEPLDSSNPRAPWPVRRGGAVLWLYSHSLSIAFFTLFLASWLIHAISGWKAHNEQQMLDHLPTQGLWEFVTGSEFWFQSLQNWQSEFLAIFTMVVLTIFLRERNSSQSKALASPHRQTSD